MLFVLSYTAALRDRPAIWRPMSHIEARDQVIDHLTKGDCHLFQNERHGTRL